MREEEVELVDYIRVVRKRRWVILAGTLFCVLATAVYIGFGDAPPPTFEAHASLIVLPPVFKTELTLPTFSLEVYRALATAQDLKQAIVDSLRLRDRGGKRLPISALDDPVLVSEIMPRSEGVSSVLGLVVTSADTVLMPPVAIANAWAALFVRKNRGIMSREAVGSYEFIRDQYQTARGKLHAAEDSLLWFAGQHPIQALEAERDVRRQKLVEYQAAYVDLALKLRGEVQSLKGLRQQLAALETPEGVWVGGLDLDGAAGAPDAEPVREATVLARERLRALQDRIRSFRSLHDPARLEEEAQKTRALLLEYTAQISALEVDSATVDRVLREVGQEGVGVQVPAGEGISEGVLREMASLKTGYNLLGPRLGYLRREATRLRREADSLDAVRFENQLELDRMRENEMLLRGGYRTLFREYVDAKEGADRARLNIQTLQARVSYYGMELERLQQEERALSLEVSRLTLEEVRLKRNVETYKSTFDKFAKLQEDARITNASQPSDVKVLTQAVEAAKTPARGLQQVLILAFASGLAASVLLAFFLEYLEKARERDG